MSAPSASPEASPTPAIICAHTESKAEEAAAAAVAAKEANEPKEKEELQWYFAIGSMINPVSMNLRNLFPKQSKPGILHGWKLVFRGGGGMGDIEEGTESDNFHGVLHQITNAEMLHLDSIESIYKRTPVKVVCYDGEVIEASAYKMDPTRMNNFGPDALPGERYIDIITRGCKHYGVEQCYIDWLQTVKCQPRKKPEEYRKVPTPPDVTITLAELKEGTGSDDKPLLCSIHGKVLRWAAAKDDATYQWARNRFAGNEAAVSVAKTLYEPLYPIPTTYEEMSEDARAWAEELMVSFTTRGNPYDMKVPRLGNWEVIGWVEGANRNV